MATKVTITNSSEVNTPTFGSLAVGDWFISNEGRLYCKIAPPHIENNAFHVSGGCLVDFDACEQITPVNEIKVCFC